ncbi:MAG: molybdate ABC transporter permease subunit [Bacillota bacterium]
MEVWLSPVLLSARIALVATMAVSCLATMAAWAVERLSWRGRGVVDSILVLPLALPPTVVGFLLLWLLGRKGPLGSLLEPLGVRLLFTWWAAVIASGILAFPLMYNAARAGLQTVDGSLESAARTLGASEPRVFFTVTLPVAWPSFLAGLVLCFMRALGEFGATLMLAGNIPGATQTMSTAIYTATEAGDMPTATLLVAIMLAFAFAATFTTRYCSERCRLAQERKGVTKCSSPR